MQVFRSCSLRAEVSEKVFLAQETTLAVPESVLKALEGLEAFVRLVQKMVLAGLESAVVRQLVPRSEVHWGFVDGLAWAELKG